MAYLTAHQERYLSELRAELRNLEEIGMAQSTAWWAVAESIDSILLDI